MCQKLETQIVTNVKKSNWDKPLKLKQQQNSETRILIKLKKNEIAIKLKL